MYRCECCGAMFEEPGVEEVCYESYYGVASMFFDYHYGQIDVCPLCGSDEVETVYCDEECDDCSVWKFCTLECRKEELYEG